MCVRKYCAGYMRVDVGSEDCRYGLGCVVCTVVSGWWLRRVFLAAKALNTEMRGRLPLTMTLDRPTAQRPASSVQHQASSIQHPAQGWRRAMEGPSRPLTGH